VSAVDTPLTIQVSGGTPGQDVTLSVTSVDAKGLRWSSSSTYVATSAGTVDPTTSPAVAGSYTGVDRMGPVEMMTSATAAKLDDGWPFSMPSRSPDDWYSWATCSLALQSSQGCAWSKPLAFVFRVSAGQAHASATVWRGPALPVTARSESVAGTGLFGVFWQPPAGQDNHIGVLEFTGSSGGIDTSIGALLAARGYPTLDIAYFDGPGLPSGANQPEDLPLEYFAKALRWLGNQAGVDPERLWLVGWSLGAQAALLVSAHYPNLVHGVVALMPTDDAWCPFWTLGGLPLPCTNDQSSPHPTDNPAALIPVADIRGPILFACGGQDLAIPSCSYSEAMMAELAAAGYPYPYKLLDYAHAGHGIGIFAPYCPGLAPDEAQLFVQGDSLVANSVARARQWPKLLAFLLN
jgi:dienelactone hydrolase